MEKLPGRKCLKPGNPDDIDPVMTIMASSLGSDKDKSADDIYNVTDYESRELNKVEANRYFGLTVGGGYTFLPNVTKDNPAGFGIMGCYDSRNVIFDLKGEFYFSDVNIYYLGLDALYPLTRNKNTPFIGGGLGWGGIKATENTTGYSYYYPPYQEPPQYSGSGLLFSAGGGYIINRNSNISMRFSGEIMVPAFTVNNSLPVSIMIKITLLIGR